MSKEYVPACRNCFWCDQCGTHSPCSYYYSVREEEYTDGQIRDMVERGRCEYELAYRDYAAQYE